jgi:hypothetical protein
MDIETHSPENKVQITNQATSSSPRFRRPWVPPQLSVEATSETNAIGKNHPVPETGMEGHGEES